MWLRRLLGAVYDLSDLSADTPAAVDWDRLPERCALQLHWPPTAALIEQLERRSFSTIVLARHPFDVLVSILQFAQNEPRTARWLNGAGGTELPLLGADPGSEAFRAYATGPRARALLGVTVEWWRSASLDTRVRFERLTGSPREALSEITVALGGASPDQVDRAIDEVTFDELQNETRNGHFWRGQPGHWRRLLTAEIAASLERAHQDALGELGYDAAADETLTVEDARRNWRALIGDRRAVHRIDPRVTPAEVDAHLLPNGTPVEFVDSAYRLVLRREPDPSGREEAIERLSTGLLSPASLVEELITSREARRIRALDDAVAFAVWARAADERPRELRAAGDVDETVIAVPWVLARYRGEPDVLDIGHAFADPAHVAALIRLGAERLRGVDPVGTDLDGMESIVGDVRSLPFADRSFDVAFCVDTLQHVGRDNRAYGLAAEADPEGELKALRELHRVLRRGGRALVTVPCGEEQDLGMLVQHTPRAWHVLFKTAGFAVFEEERYELAADGWRSTPTVEGARYGERGRTASAVLCVELRPGRARQFVRRSVGSVRHIVPMRARGIEPPRASRPTGT